jgi:cytochrome-b5 reductase
MPLVQVARAILENPEDKTKIYMIYANVTYDDILLKVLMIIFALFSFH